MKRYGLIGYPLSHSFSARYFAEKFSREGLADCVYETFPIEHIELITHIINAHDDLQGFNVTIPYKQAIIQYLNSIEDSAQCIGAVNTVKITRNGCNYQLKGYNTDAYGFHSSLEPLLGKNRIALVLGTGGASKAVAFVLDQLGFQTTFVSRNPGKKDQIAYHDLSPEIIARTGVIINTSPLGMFPNTNSYPPIPYEALTPDHLLYDLVYNPGETMFMTKGKSMGAMVVNGIQMLHLQADKAWEIWKGDK
jgi:shikimate dehydrogenase